jgi:uncharacterized membrane protein SpoIIM required for sporulation
MLRKVLVYYKDLIVSNRRWFFGITLAFVFSVVLGVFTSLFYPKNSEELLRSYANSIKPDLKEGWESMVFIYQRNVTITILASLLSGFFGITALFVTFVNGLLLGVIFGYPKIYTLASPVYLIALVAPHGVFEYFATFLSLSFGLRWGLNWTLLSSKGRRKETFLKNLKELLAILLFSSVILLLAAFIEGFLTRMVADCLFGRCSLRF